MGKKRKLAQRLVEAVGGRFSTALVRLGKRFFRKDRGGYCPMKQDCRCYMRVRSRRGR